jgi:hypothetical protein
LALLGPLAWLTRKPWWWGALFGAIGGPMAYVGGGKLGALTMPEGIAPFALATAIAYAIATPLLVFVGAWIAAKRELRHA